MPKFDVTGIVTGSKYLGQFEADNKEAAIELALISGAAWVRLCHQCSDECDSPEIEEAVALLVIEGPEERPL